MDIKIKLAEGLNKYKYLFGFWSFINSFCLILFILALVVNTFLYSFLHNQSKTYLIIISAAVVILPISLLIYNRKNLKLNNLVARNYLAVWIYFGLVCFFIAFLIYGAVYALDNFNLTANQLQQLNPNAAWHNPADNSTIASLQSARNHEEIILISNFVLLAITIFAFAMNFIFYNKQYRLANLLFFNYKMKYFQIDEKDFDIRIKKAIFFKLYLKWICKEDLESLLNKKSQTTNHATDKQKKYLRFLGCKDLDFSNLTKSEASKLIKAKTKT